jgi:two-component system sensor histidine kinase UhpB
MATGHVHPAPPRAGAGSRPLGTLFRRLLLGNGLVFATAAVVLVLSPATVSAPALVAEIAVVVLGLALLLGVNAVVTRISLRPLDGLTALMERVDLLRPGERLDVGRDADTAPVLHAFNAMLDRLEAERSASSARALDAQEGERRRIARELHDEIGQSLTAVLLGLKRTIDRAPDDMRAELQAAQEAIRTALDEVRQVARRLRPGVLDDLGLVSALNALAADFSASGTPVDCRFDPDVPDLGPETELVVYRVAQEGLTNVGRHATATTTTLSLTGDREAVVLRVADDGRGIGSAREGAGLRGMRERALLVGADLSVGPGPAGGTEIRLTVPVRPVPEPATARGPVPTNAGEEAP